MGCFAWHIALPQLCCNLGIGLVLARAKPVPTPTGKPVARSNWDYTYIRSGRHCTAGHPNTEVEQARVVYEWDTRGRGYIDFVNFVSMVATYMKIEELDGSSPSASTPQSLPISVLPPQLRALLPLCAFRRVTH